MTLNRGWISITPNGTQIYLGFLFNIYNKKTHKMKHLKTPKELNEASENLNISDVSNSALLEHFEDAVCDKNYNPTSDPYNKSGFTYEELKDEILDRIISERA